MSKKNQPQMIENNRGEVVTQGRWMSAAELEKQGRKIANHYYNVGGQSNYDQLTALQTPVANLMAAINGTIAISQCSNGLETRNFARITLEGMKAHIEFYKALWDNRDQYPDIEIDPHKFQEFQKCAETIIDLLEAYAAPEKDDDAGRNGHAELRAYLESINPALTPFSIERLGLKKHGTDATISAVVKRVNDLILIDKMKVVEACEKAADEYKMDSETVRRNYYRRGGSVTSS